MPRGKLAATSRHVLRRVKLALQQVSDVNAERGGDSFDVVDGDVASLSLDVSDERAMQASLKRQRLLAPTQLVPQTKYVDGQERPSAFHLVFFSCRW